MRFYFIILSTLNDHTFPAWSCSISDDVCCVYFRDMLTVADMNVGVPHGHLQLLSEAHVLIRTWLHRLTWLQVSYSKTCQFLFVGSIRIPDTRNKVRIWIHFRLNNMGHTDPYQIGVFWPQFFFCKIIHLTLKYF